MNYFKEYYLGAFRKFATFSGRARRKEYGWFLVFNFLATIIFSILDFLLFGDKDGVLSSIYALVVFIPSLAISVRRLHDIGKSGWFLLVIFFLPFIVAIIGALLMAVSEIIGLIIMFIGIILILYFSFYYLIFTKGVVGDNIYGSDPKALG